MNCRVAIAVSRLISAPSPSPMQAFGLDARPLSYGELADLPGGYGTVPYGATGLFRGGELIKVKSG